jgi:hypothetical protein
VYFASFFLAPFQHLDPPNLVASFDLALWNSSTRSRWALSAPYRLCNCHAYRTTKCLTLVPTMHYSFTAQTSSSQNPLVFCNLKIHLLTHIPRQLRQQPRSPCSHSAEPRRFTSTELRAKHTTVCTPCSIRSISAAFNKPRLPRPARQCRLCHSGLPEKQRRQPHAYWIQQPIHQQSSVALRKHQQLTGLIGGELATSQWRPCPNVSS